MKYYSLIFILSLCACGNPSIKENSSDVQRIDAMYSVLLNNETLAAEEKPVLLDSLLQDAYSEKIPSYSHVAKGQLYTDAKQFLMALKHFELYLNQVPVPDRHLEFCAYMRGYVMVLEFERFGNPRVQKYAEHYLKEYANQYPEGEFANSIPALLDALKTNKKESE